MLDTFSGDLKHQQDIDKNYLFTRHNNNNWDNVIVLNKYYCGIMAISEYERLRKKNFKDNNRKLR